MTDPALRARRLQRAAFAAYLGLIGLTLLWEGWLAPARGAPPGFWLTLKGLPLLVPLRGLLRGEPRKYLWASLLLLPYLMEGAILLYAERVTGFALHSHLPYALLETLLALGFTACAALYVRRR